MTTSLTLFKQNVYCALHTNSNAAYKSHTEIFNNTTGDYSVNRATVMKY